MRCSLVRVVCCKSSVQILLSNGERFSPIKYFPSMKFPLKMYFGLCVYNIYGHDILVYIKIEINSLFEHINVETCLLGEGGINVKYLGVEFDDNLNWNAHVKSVCNVLVKYAGSFKIIKSHVPKTCKRQLYFGYIYTKILYGLEVYGHTSRTNINKIQVLQNKCIKILYQKDWFTHINDLHKELNVLKVEDIFKHSMVQLVYKQRNNLMPDVFDS